MADLDSELASREILMRSPKTQRAMAPETISSGAREKIVKYAREADIRIPLSLIRPDSAVLASVRITMGLHGVDGMPQNKFLFLRAKTEAS